MFFFPPGRKCCRREGKDFFLPAGGHQREYKGILYIPRAIKEFGVCLKIWRLSKG
jgi:hypothetical protein